MIKKIADDLIKSRSVEKRSSPFLNKINLFIPPL